MTHNCEGSPFAAVLGILKPVVSRTAAYVCGHLPLLRASVAPLRCLDFKFLYAFYDSIFIYLLFLPLKCYKVLLFFSMSQFQFLNTH